MTTTQAGSATVYVCPERDIECGRNSKNWCAKCPQHDIEQAKTEAAAARNKVDGTPAGSATGIDLDVTPFTSAELDELEAVARAAPLVWYGTYQIVDGISDEKAVALIEACSPDTILALIALARATPLHPELIRMIEDLLHNSAALHSGNAEQDQDFERRYDAAVAPLLAIVEARRATPLYSVTEQASDAQSFDATIGALMQDHNERNNFERELAGRWDLRTHSDNGVDDIYTEDGTWHGFFGWCLARRAQPLASTEAAQPEQVAGADPEFMEFMRADHKPAINNIWSISHVAVHYIWKAGRAAALATPASTAPDVCAEMRALCSACGGTGDVHSIDGEWRGTCDCPASTAASASGSARLSEEHPNLKVPIDPACSAKLDELGDDRGQGLDPYWKFGFRTGWHHAVLAQRASTAASEQQAGADGVRTTLAELHKLAQDSGIYLDDSAEQLRKRVVSAIATPAATLPSVREDERVFVSLADDQGFRLVLSKYNVGELTEADLIEFLDGHAKQAGDALTHRATHAEQQAGTELCSACEGMMYWECARCNGTAHEPITHAATTASADEGDKQ